MACLRASSRRRQRVLWNWPPSTSRTSGVPGKWKSTSSQSREAGQRCVGLGSGEAVASEQVVGRLLELAARADGAFVDDGRELRGAAPARGAAQLGAQLGVGHHPLYLALVDGARELAVVEDVGEVE